MATPPFDFDETNPADSALISQFPANERASRDNIQDAFEIEHDEATGHHAILIGNTAARDAITDWVVGSLWLNTTTTPAGLDRVISIGPIVWETITQISPVTTEGDLIVAGVSGDEARLAIGAVGRYLRSDGTTAAWSALLSADLPAASETVAGVAELATAAEVAAATDALRIVTAAALKNHPGVAHAWVNFDDAGVILKSHNVTSVTKEGTGKYLITMTTGLDGAAYAVTGSGNAKTGGSPNTSHVANNTFHRCFPVTATTCRITGHNGLGGFIDLDNVTVVVHGIL